MKKFITALLFICLFAGISSADVVYNTSNGIMGVIEVTSTPDVSFPTVVYSNAGTNSLLASYANGEYARIMLIKREYDLDNLLGDTAVIFDTFDLSTVVNEFALTGSYATVKAGYSYNGQSFFTASQLGNAITEYSSQTFELLNYYNTAFTSIIRDLVVGPSFICLLLNTTDGESFVYRFDGQLKEDTESFVIFDAPAGASCIAVLGNSALAVGYPGGIGTLYHNSLLEITETASDVKAICRDYSDESSGCYYITQSESNGIYTSSLWHSYGITDTLLRTEESSESTCQAVYDAKNSVMAALMGGKIFVYSVLDDTLLDDFDSTELGGTPISLVMSTVITSNSNSSGSGSCNLTGMGVILLILAGLMTMKLKE